MKEKLELKNLAPYLPYDVDVLNTETNEFEKLKHVIHYEDLTNFKPVLKHINKVQSHLGHLYESSVTEIVDLLFNDEASIGLFNYLVSDKFDVFGLIDKGLAIDINTLD